MCGTISVFRLFSQHLPSRPGSHQQVSGSAPASQAAALRHFSTSSSKSGRRAKLMMAFMVPGLETKSIGSAEVSTMPGRARAMSCHSSRCGERPLPRSSETRLYWLPTSASMFSQAGCVGSSGGFSGS